MRYPRLQGSASLRKPTWTVGEPTETTADPSIPSRGDPARSTGCDTHVAVLGRLDVIEETVEKTVEHLEAEVKGLLSQLEGLAWNLPPGPFSPTPDLLGDDH
ncbi:placenta-specific protein 9 isoform X3 [Eptesicus fuscus]|uniref:placenta-specific protein 9 isoform X3 n=1 Tax=Eptesicus fuscus TaxID=29078 RepID=UPI0024040CB2|nr:placenta-specific protein 9 isoform X3 [Eptesicus fuscus]